MCSVIKLHPQEYVHILDRNTNVTTLIVGPQTYTCYEHQKVVLGPEQMIIIPPLHYIMVENPAKKTKEGKVKTDQYGQVLLKYQEKELRFASEYSSPFALYPGEEFVKKKVHPLQVVEVGEALRIRALIDFEWNSNRHMDHLPVLDEGEEKEEQIEMKTASGDEKGEILVEEEQQSSQFRHAGDLWLFEGPGIYYPVLEEEVLEKMSEKIIHSGQALKLSCTRDCVDRKYKKERLTGDKWLMQEPGAYLPGPYECIEAVQDALILSEERAYHITSIQDHNDIFDIERPLGSEWLVTLDKCATYQLHVYEKLIKETKLIVLTNRQYMVITNPMDEENKPLLGEKKIVRGPKKFFLAPPYEKAEKMQEVIVLRSDQALKLQATESFRDEALKKNRKPGDTWLHCGPGEYWPVLEAEITRKNVRAIISLDGLSIQIFEPSSLLFFFVLLFVAFFVLRAKNFF